MNFNTSKFRHCPVCGFEAIDRSLLISSKNPAEGLEFSALKSAFIGLRKEQVFFSYSRCPQCELLYCPLYFGNRELDELYADMPDNLLGGHVSVNSKTQESYFNHSFRLTTSKVNVLELGPDLGLSTKAILRRYVVDNLTFVEPNKSMHENLRENFEKQARLRIACRIEDVPTDTKYDLVIGIHVFDHLTSPVSELKKLKLLTSEEALLVIVVHNERSLLRYILGRKWPPFCLQHPQLFNRKTINKMLIENGWSLETIRRTKNWYEFHNLVRLACDIMGLPSRFVKHLPNFQIPLILGNILVVARRSRD